MSGVCDGASAGGRAGGVSGGAAGGGDGEGGTGSGMMAPVANDQAVAVSTAPSSSAVCWRMMNFCTLPVTVIGNSSTKRMWRGTL